MNTNQEQTKIGYYASRAHTLKPLDSCNENIYSPNTW